MMTPPYLALTLASDEEGKTPRTLLERLEDGKEGGQVFGRQPTVTFYSHQCNVIFYAFDP